MGKPELAACECMCETEPLLLVMKWALQTDPYIVIIMLLIISNSDIDYFPISPMCQIYL